MKSLKYYLMALAGIAMLNACSDDDPVPGNPTMDFQAEPSSALFGDSLPFTIKASDADVPLSTLKARLYFSDEMVSETIIRTKVNGQDYTGKIYVPYLANIPINPEKPDVPLNKNDAFQKVQKRRVQEKR